MPFEFKRQQDYDLHIALEVEEPILKSMLAKEREPGIEARGVSPRRPVIPVVIRSGDVGAPASGKGMFTERDWLVLFEHPREKVPELPALGLFPAPNNSSAMGIEKMKPRGEELSELENSLFSKLKLTGYLAIPRFKMPTMPVKG